MRCPNCKIGATPKAQEPYWLKELTIECCPACTQAHEIKLERDALRSVLAEIYSTIDPCDESQMRLLEGPNCSELLDKLLAKERL